ncbi:MAG TPA: copper chaperone PCu(A)C [Gammaproteobacteria bacterium]|nr:copper chaperone PCu(A)C [Gammaproteobacteria bacterium]
MKRTVSAIAMGMALLGGMSTALAGSAADDVTVEGLYARAVPPQQPNSEAFMTIKNNSGTDHALVGGSTPASNVVELHTHLKEDGMMKMRQIPRIDLPANEAVELAPGGLHVMLIGLKAQLEPGQEVELTLEFEDGSTMQFTAPVKKAGMGMKMKGGMKHDM